MGRQPSGSLCLPGHPVSPKEEMRRYVGLDSERGVRRQRAWHAFSWGCPEPPQMPHQFDGTLPSPDARSATPDGWDGRLSPRSKFRDKDGRLSNTFHGSQLRIKGSPSFQETSFFVCKTLSFRKKGGGGEEKQSDTSSQPWQIHLPSSFRSLKSVKSTFQRGTSKSPVAS